MDERGGDWMEVVMEVEEMGEMVEEEVMGVEADLGVEVLEAGVVEVVTQSICYRLHQYIY